jgi:hypothetical protein
MTPPPAVKMLLQFVREFAKLGLTRSVGGVLALALARELTPVVTAIILAGRVGSAFAAELGTMQVRQRGTAAGLDPQHRCVATCSSWCACGEALPQPRGVATTVLREKNLAGDCSIQPCFVACSASCTQHWSINC